MIMEMEILNKLSLSREESQMLLAAAKGKDLGMIEKLIWGGVDPNCADKQGRTPLMKAIMNGNMLIADRLIELGADPEIIDREGKTASSYLKKRPKNENEPCIKIKYSMIRAQFPKKL
jgi:ankyrin repeat protein